MYSYSTVTHYQHLLTDKRTVKVQGKMGRRQNLYFWQKKYLQYESLCRCRKVRASVTKVLDFFLLIFARSQKARFGVCFSKNRKNLTSKIFGGPRALELDEKSENFEFFFFFTSKPYFFKLNLNCTCSQLSFEVHNTLETQNFENFEFF